ncbi:MAG: DUF2235 domain-containing protein [Pirellulales bacterium]
MGRRVVLCIDGTDNSPTAMAKNEDGETEPVRTNVSRFFRMLVKQDATQSAYYQPGVGTIDPERSDGKWAKVRNWIGRKRDSLFARSLRTHVAAAYTYLMNEYRDDDEVFLLGFSRGAFVCRVLAGMVHKVGLLHRGHDEMVPFAWQVYLPRQNFEAAGRFKKFYSRTAKIRFLGLWDTVSSVGNPLQMAVFPHTQQNDAVAIVRHAMAIDERRVMFQQNLWTDSPPARQDVLQVWFPGVHADIGGGYTGDSAPGLAGIPLAWMVQEARLADVEFDEAQVKRLLWPRWLKAPDPLDIQTVTQQYAGAEQHDEIQTHLYWRVLEKLPLPRTRRVSEEEWRREYSRHQSAPRNLKSSKGTTNTIRVHHSADVRKERRPDYAPVNLLLASEIPRVW